MANEVTPLGVVTHALTHRRYEFTVFACDAAVSFPATPPRVWATLAELDRLPLSKPQLKVAELARNMGRNDS
jgi:adenine-specific DNA glycosylase